ncbi:ExbD/TolR family protein [Roseateles cellulosilyticus]|uniref:Biopolymer transporter ExbD n=1 Tax=Pelomonas cellulosilytica TaxID=2906762 RepID=A0ABS8XJ94_9BURK|nr:biopolymer transporter ExbD [Pelomonas sp. P8]MCE4552932.1 biopolymer transporter ExbD [Pelomonas sp. P8]
MKLTPVQKRAARMARNNSGLDMNLVALIDIFTILIFFLMSSTGIEVLTNSRAVKLPNSVAEKTPRQTIVVSVSETDIVVDGRKVADVADAMQLKDDLIPGLKAELDLLASRPVLGADKDGTSKAVTIMGDKRIPYSLLRKVMATGARAGFVEIAFAVQRKT